MRLTLVAAALPLALASPAAAQVVLAPADLQWTEVAPGVAFANTHGNWRTGAHGKFVRFAPGAVVGMHTHSAAYQAVVISGHFTNGYRGMPGRPMEPGTFWSVEGGVPHDNSCVSEEPCIIYTTSDAAVDVTMVEPDITPPRPAGPEKPTPPAE